MPSASAAAASPDLVAAMRELVRYRREHLSGDEKGEGQIFLEHLFQAFGHAGLRQAGAFLEARLRRRSGAQKRTSFADCIWKPRVLIEMKKAGEPLGRHYEQALEYWFRAVPDRPRYVVLCNFDELWVYDFNHQIEEPMDRLRLEELPRRWEALAFMLPEEVRPTFGNDLVAVTRESAARVSAVFNHLVDRGVDWLAAQRFVIDIVADDAMTAAAIAPGPFERVRDLVLPDRQAAVEEEQGRNRGAISRHPGARVNLHHQRFLNAWWQHSWRRPAMIAALSELPRYLAVARLASEHRLPVFTFVAPEIRPDTEVVVFALADDYSFGILQSGVHVAWFRERCSHLESRPRYTSKTVFDSFPWPQAPAQDAVDRVVEVVAELLAFRAERMAQGITIGQQYDSLRQPGRSRLRDLHHALDRAVLEVYGFDPDEDLLAQILALNLSLAELEQASGAVRGPGPQGLANTTRTAWRVEPVHRLA